MPNLSSIRPSTIDMDEAEFDAWCRDNGTVSRRTQQHDVIYVFEAGNTEEVFVVGPDGEGRYWYDSVEEAKEEHGALRVQVLEVRADD